MITDSNGTSPLGCGVGVVGALASWLKSGSVCEGGILGGRSGIDERVSREQALAPNERPESMLRNVRDLNVRRGGSFDHGDRCCETAPHVVIVSHLETITE